MLSRCSNRPIDRDLRVYGVPAQHSDSLLCRFVGRRSSAIIPQSQIPHSEESLCYSNPALPRSNQRRTVLSRSAFVITETELKLMAAAAIIGLSSKPKNGYKIPAAMGTPIEL